MHQFFLKKRLTSCYIRCQQPNNFSYKLDSQHISYFGLVHFPVSGALPCEKLLNCERGESSEYYINGTKPSTFAELHMVRQLSSFEGL